jgi:hypothetical protein
MSVTLSKSVTVAPAVAAITATTFDLIDVQENYGHGTENQGGGGGRGRRNSVEATIVFSVEPPVYRTVIAWEDDAYLAVRGTWTDDTLKARIKEILEAE